MKNGRCRGHRVGRIELASGDGSPKGESCVAGNKGPPGIGKLPILAQRNKLLLCILETRLEDAQVLVYDRLTLVLEGFLDDFFGSVEIKTQKEH